jgi:hypothetical protein
LANKEEVEILPPDVLDKIEIILVNNADEVIPLVLLPKE